jgi:hypothetical protein
MEGVVAEVMEAAARVAEAIPAEAADRAKSEGWTAIPRPLRRMPM